MDSQIRSWKGGIMDIRVGQNGAQGAAAAAVSSFHGQRKSRAVGTRNAKQSKKKKKKLKYNPQEIPSQLMRASKLVSASEVLVRARGKAAVLMRSAATGDYDEAEVRAAVNHANRIVKCARLKVNHLKEEEQKKRVDERKHSIKSAKYRIKKMELQRKKRLHRIEEKAKIDEADAKYRKEKGSNSKDYSPLDELGVSLEMSDAACAYNEKKLLEKELKELEQEMGMEMSQMADAGGLDENAILSCADGGDIGADLPECAL